MSDSLSKIWLWLTFHGWMTIEWFRSSLALYLFGIAAANILIVTAFLGGFPSAVHYLSTVYHGLWLITGGISALGMLFLWVGMWRYWILYDDSNVYAKRRWFLVLLVGFWYGSCLYYFFAYLPQVRRARRSTA